MTAFTATLDRWAQRLHDSDDASFLSAIPGFVEMVRRDPPAAYVVEELINDADRIGREHIAAEQEHDDAAAKLLDYTWDHLARAVGPSAWSTWLTTATRRFEQVYRDRGMPAVVPFDPQVKVDGGRLGLLLSLVDEALSNLARPADPLVQAGPAVETLRAAQAARNRSFRQNTDRHAGVALLRLQLLSMLTLDPASPPAVTSDIPALSGPPALEVRELGQWGWTELISAVAEAPYQPLPAHLPGLVARLRDAAEILTFELGSRDYAPRMLYHVRVSTSDARRRADGTSEAFAFHITEDQLRARFVEPWTERHEILCSGLTFNPEETRIEIFQDPNASSQPWAGRTAWQRAVASTNTRDVTDQFLPHRRPASVRTSAPSTVASEDQQEPSIFVVHGRDDARKFEAARTLERCTDREVVILHEQPNRGQTIIEKFEQHAQTAAFAVILMTADDVGGTSASELSPRARQNVVFEHGFFAAAIGRQRVAVLCDLDIERPSDISGLVYIPFDSAGAWKTNLLREIQATDIEVDFSKLV